MPRSRFRFATVLLLLTASAQAEQPAPPKIDELARDVSREESLRAVKNVQRSYAQYAQFGLWGAMADEFAAGGKVVWGDRTIEGKPAIAAWLASHSAPAGTVPGATNTELIDDPLVNLSVDGKSAQGRWRGLALRGDGKGTAWMEGGLYENDYVMEGGRWKIATLHYYPQYEGSYATGWSNVGEKDMPIVPYHFTVDETGIPIPKPEGAAPASGASAQALSDRVGALNDEDDVRNLQNAYGYYVDMRMWDDVVDLFADDGAIEIAGKLHRGKAGVRQAMARMGPAGLTRGILNDRLPFDTLVKVMPGGLEAYARGTELAMIGNADAGTASWQVNVFRNRFVRENGLWKIREMRLTPVMAADYAKGWGSGGTLGAVKPPMPALLGPDPATGAPVATGRLAVNGVTIDSPLENLALYDTYMKTGTLPGVTLPANFNPASLLAAAADKTGNITVDTVVYMNSILGVNSGTTYHDFSTVNYDRYTTWKNATATVLVLQPDGVTYKAETVNLYDAVFNSTNWTDPTATGGADDFAAAADDYLKVIEFVHDNGVR